MSRFRVITSGGTLYGRPVPRTEVISVVEEIQGWWGPPPSVGGVTQRPYSDGVDLDEAHYGGRTLVLKGSFAGDDPASVRDEFERFMGGLSAKDLSPLAVEELGLIRHVWARLEGDPQIDWKGLTLARYNLQFICPDYRKYGGDGSAPQYEASAYLPYSAGGLMFPAVAPFVMDAVTVSGEVLVTNQGNAPLAPIATIHGPALNPRITTTDGRQQNFRMVLEAGEELVVDFDRRKVTLGEGGVSRRGVMVGDWLAFDKQETVVLFTAEGGVPDTTRLTMAWSDSHK